MTNATVSYSADAGQQDFPHPFIATPSAVEVDGLTASFSEVVTTTGRVVRLTTPATEAANVAITGTLPEISPVPVTGASGGGGGGGAEPRGAANKAGSLSVTLATDEDPIDVVGPLTNAQLRASEVPITGTVEITNDTGSAIPVSGVLTDTELRAAPVAVQGTVEITNDAGSPIPVSLADAATETTLAELNAKVANTASGALLMGTARDRFFDNFHDFDTVSQWEVFQVGSGMVISGPLGGAAAGSSPYLNIASGTAINQKTVLLSRATFNAPVDLRYQITASQRIANNRLLIGFVQVDEAGSVLTSTTITTAPDVLNARNAVVHQHDGTTATTAQLRVRAAGSALDTFANAFGTGFTTVATGTSPSWLTATTYGLTIERDKINARAYGQNALTNTGGQFSYDRVLPNPTVKYKLVIIVENQGTAPASSTDWRLHLINVLDATRLDVSPRNAGSTDGAKAMPIWAVGGSLSVTATLASTVVTPAAPTASTINSAATTNGTVVKATAGTIYGLVASNTSASDRFLKLYNSATVTVGTTAVALTLKIPAGNFIEVDFGPMGMRYGTGICLSITGAAPDNDTTAIAAGEVKVNTAYI